MASLRRLATFLRYPKDRYLFPSKLANDGFCYVEAQDCVRCDLCAATFCDWKKGIEGAHSAHSSLCEITSSGGGGVGTFSASGAFLSQQLVREALSTCFFGTETSSPQRATRDVLHQQMGPSKEHSFAQASSLMSASKVIRGLSSLNTTIPPIVDEALMSLNQLIMDTTEEDKVTTVDGQDLKHNLTSLPHTQQEESTKISLFNETNNGLTKFNISGGKMRVASKWLFQLGSQNLPPVHVYTLGAAPEAEGEEQLGQGQDQEQGQGQQPGQGQDLVDQDQGQVRGQEQQEEQGIEVPQQQPEGETEITTANELLSMRSERLRYASFRGAPDGRIQDWPRRLSAKGYLYDVEHDSITCFYCHCGPGRHHGHCEWKRCNIPFKSTSFPPAEPSDALQIAMGATLRQRRGTARSFDTTEPEQMAPSDGQSATSGFAEETGDASATNGFYPAGSTLERQPPTRASTGTRQLDLSVLQKQTNPSQHSYNPPISQTSGFKCANCEENPATIQVPSCGHVVCPSCLDPGQRVICPVCRADTRHT